MEQIKKGSKKVKLEIGNTIGGKFYNLENVRAVKNLELPTLPLNATEMNSAYPFVGKEIWQKVSNAKPMILLGQDYANLTVTRIVIQPTEDSVILSNCHLGLSVHGPIATST
jgi:hypothetical protein